MSGKTRLLVEAKSHIPELCSPPSAATGKSLSLISWSLKETSEYPHAKPFAAWGVHFYQLTNRLAHLWFLRRHRVDARLLLVNFLGDCEQGGPETEAEWAAAYIVACRVLGLSQSHKLNKYVSHVCLHVDDLKR